MTNWRTALKELQTAAKVQADDWPIMSPLERKRSETEVGELRARHYGPIEAGAIQEWRATLDGFRKAQGGVQKARSAEKARWDAGKLTAEMGLVKARVREAIAAGTDPLGAFSLGARLQEIFTDGMESGDTHKMRAVAEAFRGILAEVPSGEERVIANHLAHEGERRLEELRDTPEIRQSKVAIRESFGAVSTAKNELEQVARAIYGCGLEDPFVDLPIISEARRFRIDPMTTQITILDAFDTRVTGHISPDDTRVVPMVGGKAND